ncbi:MAG: hypothetical protein GY810_13460 [Aureispira sp.]|nr:hypothetical protein [Aureispira sp.]
MQSQDNLIQLLLSDDLSNLLIGLEILKNNAELLEGEVREVLEYKHFVNKDPKIQCSIEQYSIESNWDLGLYKYTFAERWIVAYLQELYSLGANQLDSFENKIAEQYLDKSKFDKKESYQAALAHIHKHRILLFYVWRLIHIPELFEKALEKRAGYLGCLHHAAYETLVVKALPASITEAIYYELLPLLNKWKSEDERPYSLRPTYDWQTTSTHFRRLVLTYSQQPEDILFLVKDGLDKKQLGDIDTCITTFGHLVKPLEDWQKKSIGAQIRSSLNGLELSLNRTNFISAAHTSSANEMEEYRRRKAVYLLLEKRLND